jgi:translation initiation factor 2-alpha kinase 4
MSHPPVSTLMERAKILTEIRKKEIIFSEYFDQVNMSNQAHVIRWLLNHIPSERPTSNELLNSPHIPYKIQEDLLQEAVIHTLQNPNSARYRYLMKKLFSSQAVSKYVEMAFFVDHYHQLDSESSLLKQNQSSYILLQQFVWTTVENIFIRHCGWRIKLPLLDPNSHLTNNECSVKMLEPTGKLLYLPIDHWVSFSRYVLQHDITFLKRYDDFIAYYPPSIPGTHPKELRRYVFDIVNTTNANRFICIAELMCMILEIMSELNIQGILRINHTSLLTALLTFCSVDTDQHDVVLQFLYNVCNGNNKISDIEKHFKDALHVHLSPLALKTLVKFITSQVPLEEIRSLLDPLLKSRTTVSSVVEKAVKDVEVLQDHLNTFQDNPKVLFYPGLVLNLSYFQGIIFEAILTRSQTVNKTRGKKQTQLLAIGGSYNKLLESVKQYNRSSSLLPSQYNVHNITICGVSINEDILLKRLMNVYGDGQISAPISKCHALICSVSGDTPFTKEGISLVTELRDKGAAVEFLLEHMNLESIQEFCRHRLIPHLIVLDNTLLLRQQVKVRTLDIGKEKVISERILHRSEVFDYIQSRYSNEKSSDLVESGIFSKLSATSAINQDIISSLPPVTITTVGRQLQGTVKRRIDNQILSKLLPLLQKVPSKSAVEIVAVELELEPLCILAAEMNRMLGLNKSSDFSRVVKLLMESDNSLGKKYITQVCETIVKITIKRVPVLFLYSHMIEQCQIVLNNFFVEKQ